MIIGLLVGGDSAERKVSLSSGKAIFKALEELGNSVVILDPKDGIHLLKDKIISDIKNNNIILYMKGTKEMPMCGFSSTVVKVLSMYNVDYKDINVLEDPSIRIKLSEHSNWPTIPQLFVKGELIGGCDIIVELHNSNELEKILSWTYIF